MKSTLKFFGVIALAALIAFSTAACSGGINITVEETGGNLTINGLEEHDGKWVFATGTLVHDIGNQQVDHLFAAQDITGKGGIIAAGLISGGSATLKLWKLSGPVSRDTSLSNFNFSGELQQSFFYHGFKVAVSSRNIFTIDEIAAENANAINLLSGVMAGYQIQYPNWVTARGDMEYLNGVVSNGRINGTFAPDVD